MQKTQGEALNTPWSAVLESFGLLDSPQREDPVSPGWFPIPATFVGGAHRLLRALHGDELLVPLEFIPLDQPLVFSGLQKAPFPEGA